MDFLLTDLLFWRLLGLSAKKASALGPVCVPLLDQTDWDELGLLEARKRDAPKCVPDRNPRDICVNRVSGRLFSSPPCLCDFWKAYRLTVGRFGWHLGRGVGGRDKACGHF